MTIINHECYVSLEVAKLLKEAGFNWECSGHWVETNKNNEAALFALSPKPCLYNLSIVDVSNSNLVCMCTIQDWNVVKDENGFQFYYSAPTLDVAQRWLREVKGIHICVKADAASINCKYFVTVIISDTKWGNVQDENMKTILFNTYEEAQEAGIQKCLTILLNEDK
jgi:hypothetical protein